MKDDKKLERMRDCFLKCYATVIVVFIISIVIFLLYMSLVRRMNVVDFVCWTFMYTGAGIVVITFIAPILAIILGKIFKIKKYDLS